MNDGLKQRLIGAVVLIALAIILWPFVFGPAPAPTATSKPVIDEPPPFKQFEIPQPQQSRDVPDVDEYQRQLRERQQHSGDSEAGSASASPAKAQSEAATPGKAVPAHTASAVATPAKTGLDEQGLPVAWVVQVGSFSDAGNAANLMAKLQQKGYHAATQQTSTDQGNFTRVFIGPTVDHDRAQKTLEVIRKSYPHARLERFVPPADGFGG